MATCNHIWRYRPGMARCEKCGRYLHPDGRVTRTPDTPRYRARPKTKPKPKKGKKK